MELRWHGYRYFPYERALALREVKSLLRPTRIVAGDNSIRIAGRILPEAVRKLVYFAEAQANERSFVTLQGQLERVNGNGPNRQSTRYSVHGLHEYKGKFNPQTARAILNILGVKQSNRILDPFCGSGTTLVECAHLGFNAVGADVNPMAIYIANAKLKALKSRASSVRMALERVLARVETIRDTTLLKRKRDARADYLRKWFDSEVLRDIERLRSAICARGAEHSEILLCVASNLLREYSLQDPNDLRIRRRQSPLPSTPFYEAFERASQIFIERLADAQSVLGIASRTATVARLIDARVLTRAVSGADGPFDCAITSPPYATALPYIDTQRLSLVWLGLVPPARILTLEASLVGSREARGAERSRLKESMLGNAHKLPKEQAVYCLTLSNALGAGDGFRRQAVPGLLYRYFVDMKRSFGAIRKCMRKDAPYALIVGGNHTVLGGRRFDIGTASHLISLARSEGWVHQETIALQTYQRYGYHMGNAISSESLVILRAR
ncbi:MAG: DNA methyltransferase [Burkholderiales bacterium]